LEQETTIMKRTLALAALLTVGGATFAPLPAMAQVNVIIGAAPPPPRFERAPAPRHGYIWSQGHWEWNGHRHYWTPGVWVAERPGYVYSAPVWYQDGGRWQMRPAGWSRGGPDRDRDGIPDRFERPHGGDRDRDGIPDRFERPRGDRDHDGVPNRYDRDRDGDGVPNRHDRAPDNPRRD
jgi:hypothetical protein